MGCTSRRLAVLAAVLLTVGGLSGCFGHSDEHPGAGKGASASPVVTAPLQVRSGVTRVVGELDPDARKQLASRAGALVEAYFRAAFLDRGAARASAAKVFPGFTSAARSLAAGDRKVLTGAGYKGADRIEPQGGTAYVNVLAPHGHPVGATVRVTLALRVTEHGRTRPVDVAGRLLLTPTPQGWRIFGYDLSQSGSHARSTR